MARELIKGNIAMAEAAIRAGLDAYFGYPITPQNEILEYLSGRMPQLGRAFVQAESEVAAVNMVYGAACAGAWAMSSSSGPGMSLMMEGISYIAGTEIPAVFINVMRGGPGLGNIAPAQGDYFQAVRGGGHGDYHAIVLTPGSVQESIDQTVLAFDLAEKYNTMAFILTDGLLGQMMEPAELPEMRPLNRQQKAWMVDGAPGRPRRVLSSIYLEPLDEEKANLRMLKNWHTICANEVRYKEYYLDDADFVVMGFGTSGRIALSAVRAARAQGIKVGLLRPITVSPFPYKVIEELLPRTQAILVVEMNTGQMLEDVQLAARGRIPVEFYGRPGGVVPFADDILREIQRISAAPLRADTDPRSAWLERALATG